ncbi:hypothetical protein QKQ_1767 [Clostridioides difficile DA00196]|nr:hypothetical protein QKQ_1767 [Clostridioides difficile DA00196]
MDAVRNKPTRWRVVFGTIESISPLRVKIETKTIYWCKFF